MKQSIFFLSLIFIFIGCSSSENDSPDVGANSKPATTVPIKDKNISEEILEVENISTSLENNISNIADTDIISEVVNNNRDIDMVLKRAYKVEKGDYLLEIDNAKVKIIKNSENDFSEVILLSGRAKIIRGAKNWF